MDTLNKSNGLRSILEAYLPEGITTALYASAISSMLSFSMNLDQGNIDIFPILNSILIVFLLIADWNSRILVPLGFSKDLMNDKKKPKYQYAKLISELISLVLLVMFYSYFINENYNTDKTINIYSLFALYLLSCGVWNIIMIRIMHGIDLIPLLSSIFRGNVFEIEDLKKYTKSFVEKVIEEEKTLADVLKEKVPNIENEGDGCINEYKKKKRILSKKIIVAKTIVQFIGNHITWVNIVVGLMYGLSSSDFSTSFNNLEVNLGNNFTISFYVIKLILLFILGLLLTILLSNKIKTKVSQTFFGLTSFLFLLLFYSSVPLNCLIYIMVIQQIIIGLLIEFITDGNNLKKQVI